jgi:hypothetical protein
MFIYLEFPPFLMVRRHTARLSAVLSLALLSLSACTTSITDQGNFRAYAESYIRANINDISTRSPVVGGTFQVKDIEWVDDDTVRVSFEDGHIALKGTADVRMEDEDTVVLTRLRLENSKNDDKDEKDEDDGDEDDKDDDDKDEDEDDEKDDDAHSSKSSTSSASSPRAKADLGEFCGGIAAFQCKDGLSCKFDGTYPDAGGKCVDDD